jgi:glycosyltransferase involved in cell wall biosynthesis
MSHLWNGWLVPGLKRAGARNLLVVHDAQPHPGENYLLRNALMRRDVRQADAVITLTEAVRRQVLALCPIEAARCFVVPMGTFGYGGAQVHGHQPRPLPVGRPVRLLFFGRLRPYKGLDQLLAAHALLREDGHAVELDIVGSGSLGSLVLPEGVRVRNEWVEEEEIPAIFARADIAVLPYTEASQSGVLPIAADFAMPSVVTPVGGLVEQMNGAGVVARDATARGIAEAIAALLDPDRYRAASAVALGQAGVLGWARSARKIERIIMTQTASADDA